MSYPSSKPAVPAVVQRIARGRSVRAVWVNEAGGITFRVGSDEFVKVGGRDFTDEARRLHWASEYLAVPRVLGLGTERGLVWLRTAALPGLSAVHPRWLAAPRVAVRAIGEGLRALHDRLPVRSCPFDWSAQSRLTALAPSVRARLGEPPPVDRLVVCHGDACAPNTLIGDDGRWRAHVDFDCLGVADRWADLAVATLSLGWNYPGGESEDEFYAAYGVEPDAARVDYYRRLWQAPDESG